MTLVRVHVVACRIFQRELEALAAGRGDVSVEYLEMGLHAGPTEEHHAALRKAADGAPECEAVALAYGMCNRGIIGLRAGRRPLVIPRAHDCLAVLLGSRERYLAEMEAHPATYFQSAGWIENLPQDGTLRLQSLPEAFGPGLSRAELVARYGEENAAYLLEQLTGLGRHYDRLAFINTPVPESAACRARAAQMAREHRWGFVELQGDVGWLARLVRGVWKEEEFLVVPAGQQVVAQHDGLLIGAEPAT
jgi:hypothetical protein